jgi:hypothetical protein
LYKGKGKSIDILVKGTDIKSRSVDFRKTSMKVKIKQDINTYQKHRRTPEVQFEVVPSAHRGVRAWRKGLCLILVSY